MGPMRESQLGTTQARRAAGVRAALRIAAGPRNVRRKPRSAEERAVIVAMASAGMRRRVEAGRLQANGPRAYTVLTETGGPAVCDDHPSTTGDSR